MASDTRLTLSYDVSNATTPTYHAYADYNFVMTFTANDGYQFVVGDSANYLEYADSSTWIPADNRYVTVDGVVKQLRMTTQMKDYPTSAVMHVKAYEIAQIPVIQNLANCTSSFNDISTPPNSTVSFTLTAENNFKFNSAPSFTINSSTSTFSRVSDYVYSDTFTAPSSGTIIVDATAIRESFNITQNLVNCTSNFTDSTVAAGSSISVTLTGNSSTALTPLVFTTTPTITNGNFSRVSDYQYSCFNLTVVSDTTISGSAGGEGGYTVEYTMSNCSATPAFTNISYNTNYTIIVTADTGYKFDSHSVPYYKIGKIDDTYPLTKISDYEYALHTENVGVGNLRIYGTALQDIEPQPTPSTISYGFIDIYLPSMQALKNLSKKRFFNSDNNNVDMFQYVYKVHKMYFNIPPEMQTTIALAYYRTNVVSYATSNAFAYANCGSVLIPELYGNIFDYQHTTSKFYLPFIGYQNIDTADIMNSTVNLEYKANIVTGKILAVISTAERGELYQFEGYGGFDIPYMLNNFNDGFNHDLFQSSAYLGSLTPSIQLFTNIPYGDNNNPFGYAVSTWCKIGDCTGYIKCEDIQLIISQNYITNSEMNMIMELLKNGVFVS